MKKYNGLTDEAIRQELHLALAELEKRGQKVFEEQNIEPVTLSDSYDAMIKSWSDKSELHWPFVSLEKRLGGYWPGELYTIGGTTGIGKSLLTAYLVLRYVLDGGKALYFSTEMPNKETTQRMYHMWQNYLQDKDNFVNLYLEYGDEKYSVTPDIIELMLKRNKERSETGMDKRYTLVVIDNLHWFMRGGESVSEDIGIVTKRMKELALRYDVSIILVSHVNRTAAMGEKNKTPAMAQLKGSSYIEQDSDAVIMITRMKDEYGKSINKSLISLEKNRRNGRTFQDVELTVDKNLCFRQTGNDPE
jgi:replicative DNA helicase